MKPKIIFIHGIFLNPKSWGPWLSYFERLGYQCEGPAWPMHEGEPSSLRQNVPGDLRNLSLAAVFRHYAFSMTKELRPPIVIGHSMGGLVMQKLASAGLIRAGVGICSVPPNRMLAADRGFLRNIASFANHFAGNERDEMTLERFRQNFGNTMTEAESNAVYQRYAVHESRQVLRDVLGDDGELETNLPHVPLLFVGAEDDEIIPASLVNRNAHAYTDERSHSECVAFSSRGHFICGQNGWEEVALRVSNWLESHLLAYRS